MIMASSAAHAGTPIRQIVSRPWDFVSAVYSVFSAWQLGEAFRGASVSPWRVAVQVLQYTYMWWYVNPVATFIILALVAFGLGWLYYSFVAPRINAALRARGFST